MDQRKTWRTRSNQLTTVLWEHYKVRRRHFVLTLLEVLAPIGIFVFVAFARSTLPSFVKEHVPATYNEGLSDFLLSSGINIRDTKLLFTPYTDFTDAVTREMQLKLHMYNGHVLGFDTKEDIMRYYRENGDEGITVIADFRGAGQETPEDLRYDLQMYERGVNWQTERLYRNDVRYFMGAGSHLYLGNQFLAFQWALDTSYIELLTATPLDISMTFQEFPYPPHWTDNGMNDVFVHLLPLLAVLCFSFLFPSILKTIVEEKASGMKQLMKINGLKSWAYWLGWFFNAYSICCVSAVIVAILLTQRIFHEEYSPLQHVQIAHLIALLLLYCSATVSFIFAFSLLFRKATLAMVIGMTVWFLSYIVYVSTAVNMEVLPLHVKCSASLMPHVALYYGFEIISVGEIRERPVGLTERPRCSDDDMTMQLVLGMLALDTILFLSAAIFFESDPCGRYRISKMYANIKKSLSRRSYASEADSAEAETRILIEGYVQEDSEGVPVLEIRNLTKRFGDVIAVRDLSLKIYDGTLTVLLGHNGAGKTTIMSILAGLEGETSGEVVLNEVDSVDLKDRQLVSICPQENMLFPELSVEEHLIFFGKLKGLSAEEIETNVEDLLRKKLRLYEKKDEPVKNLSGGMKRKLSIGVAIMGRPKLLILDEPTAGIDPEGRRDIWDMIRTCKDDCSILISTHLMEEAEELADRVAIIAHGSLECYGTPMFLKELFGVGYRLRLHCRNPESRGDVERFFTEQMDGPVSGNIVEEEPLVMEYSIEKDRQGKFSRLLSKLDDEKGRLSIEGYKISSISLEDIFLKTLERFNFAAPSKNRIQIPQFNRTESIISRGSERSSESGPTGCFRCNFTSKFKLILEKKLKFLRRTGPTWISMIALFYLLVALTFTMGDTGYKDLTRDGKTLQLQLEAYGTTNVYYSAAETESGLGEIYENLIRTSGSTPHKTDDLSETIIQRGNLNIVEYRMKMVVGSEFKFREGSLRHVNVMYSNQANHGAPVSLNLVTNALVKYLTGEDHSITATHTPLRAVNSLRRQTNLSVADNLLLWMILLPTGCLFSVIMFAALPTLERNTLMIILSHMYNLHSHCYWIINYLIDIATYAIIIALPIVVLSLLSFCGVTIMEISAVGILIVILVWYGVTIVPFTYATSFLAKSTSTAFAMFIIPNMCFSPILAGIVMSMEMADQSAAKPLLWLFAVTEPHVILTYSLSIFCIKTIANHNWDMKTPEQRANICSDTPVSCCDPQSVECLNERAYLQHPEYLAVSFLVALLLIVMLIFADRGENGNVTERSDINVVRAKDVKKTYRAGFWRTPVTAVKMLNFEVRKGECFGLLGVNGAGKSTSFRLITRQESPNEGKVFMGDKAQLGYCPQDHAMIDVLSGKELLTYFGKLRDPTITAADIDDLLKKCGLCEYGNRPCGTYSGGNKRKLNTCIGLIGSPEVIALDEPTTGVDPENRKKIRDLIAETKTNRCSAIIFTSHSMDECEKLCDRLSIMRGGEIVTGTDETTVEDLKKKYNVGHVVQIKMKRQQQDGVLSSLRKNFPELAVWENRNDMLKACVTGSDWRTIFEQLEQLKSMRTDILDYAVQESSLEQVFLQVAKG